MQSFYRRKKRYVCLRSVQIRKLKQLQNENTRLQKLVHDLTLSKAILQEVAAKTGRPRQKRQRWTTS